MRINSYQELIVWQKSIELVKKVYLLSNKFPADERFGITSQMRRAAISIPSNIAEGYDRRSQKEYLQFFAVSYGSALELETQLIVARELGMSKNENFADTNSNLNEVIKMLYVMIYRKKEEHR